MSNQVLNSISRYWTVIPLLLVFVLVVSESDDPYHISLLVLASFLYFFLRKKNLSLTPVDFVILAIWLYEFVSLFVSINPVSSFSYFLNVTNFTLFYFVVRTCFQEKKLLGKFLFAGSLYLSLLAFLGILAFYIFKGRIFAGGFSDLYDFRAQFLPLRNLPNVWSNLLLGFLTFITISIIYNRKHSLFLILLLFPVLFGLIISFSRGIYIALTFIICTLVIVFLLKKIRPDKKEFITISGILILCICVTSPYITEIKRTFRMNESVSQQRSIDGRIRAGEIIFKIFKDHPVTGTGPGTYSLAANQLAYEKDPSSFTRHASGIAFQLPAEKGILGSVLWVVLFIITFYFLISGKNKTGLQWVILIFLVALLVRELTFPVLLNHAGLQLIVFTCIAITQNNRMFYLKLFNVKFFLSPKIAWVPLALWLIIFLHAVYVQQDKKHYKQCLQAFREENLSEALEKINRTSLSIPYLINRSTIYQALFCQTGERSYLENAEKDLQKAIKKNPLDFQLQHNLGKVLYEKGEKKEAFTIFEKLVDDFPYHPLYQLSLAVFYLDCCEIDSAGNYFAQTALLSPSLLDTPLWEAYIKTNPENDSIISKYLNIKLNISLHQGNPSPVEYAKYGKVYLYLRDTATAKSYLREAVEKMPGLPRPWAHLGMIAFEEGNKEDGERYLEASRAIAPWDNVGVAYREKYKGEMFPPILSGKENEYDMLYEIYYAKFRQWYRIEPVKLKNYICCKYL